MYKLEFIKDIAGFNYLAINIYEDRIYWFIDKLKKILGDDYEEFYKYKFNRDGNKYHITVISTSEIGFVMKKYSMSDFVDSIQKLEKYSFDDIKMKGIGRAEKNGNISYYIVVESEKLDILRNIYGLGKKDFHITLGFKYKDVHGVPKNIILDEEETFLKKLSIEFYKNYNFDFIKDLNYFDSNSNEEILPIKINSDKATFKVGKNQYYTILLDNNDNIVIGAKWEDNEEKNVIPWTIVERKLKKYNKNETK